jgi:hypothetical protein
VICANLNDAGLLCRGHSWHHVTLARILKRQSTSEGS